MPWIYKSFNLRILKFWSTFYFFMKFILMLFSLDDFKSLKSWEQIKGAKKPVRKTSAKMFWILGTNSKKVPSEKFLKKI